MKICKETYIRRRAQLKKDVSSGLLLFLGNDEVGMNYADNTYRFRQDSTMLYFFGLDFPGIAAIIDIDEDREIVFGNDLTIDDIVWTGSMPSLKERCEPVGITDVRPMSELAKIVNGKSANRTREALGSSKKSVNRKYEDRPIDIDILLYDNLTIDEPDLKIPHPLMHQRDFVMIPLNEIKTN